MKQKDILSLVIRSFIIMIFMFVKISDNVRRNKVLVTSRA